MVFVGDLGDEDLEIVEAIDALQVEKVVILGNHDAWQSFSNRRPTRRLLDMVEQLGEDHLGYGLRDLDRARVSLVGGRPFSWGGKDLRSPEVYGEFYGVHSAEESAQLIVETADRAKYRDLVIIAHNGPYGLSDSARSIYGKDFGRRPGGDWGDRDLEAAIEQVEARGKRVRAVIAGHMHDRLHAQVGGLRERFVRRRHTSFINPAVVPRIRHSEAGGLRHYVRASFAAGDLEAGLEEIWVDGEGQVRERFSPRFAERSRGSRSKRRHAEGGH